VQKSEARFHAGISEKAADRDAASHLSTSMPCNGSRGYEIGMADSCVVRFVREWLLGVDGRDTKPDPYYSSGPFIRAQKRLPLRRLVQIERQGGPPTPQRQPSAALDSHRVRPVGRHSDFGPSAARPSAGSSIQDLHSNHNGLRAVSGRILYPPATPLAGYPHRGFLHCLAAAS
jgi:hypothetical protein